MIVKIVTLHVKHEQVNAFVEATIENQRHSMQEPGIRAFDFWQGQDDPTRFVLYEAYESDEAVKAHATTPHYKKWADAAPEFYTKPRERALYEDVKPIE